jgi:hypothetical protein
MIDRAIGGKQHFQSFMGSPSPTAARRTDGPDRVPAQGFGLVVGRDKPE